MNNLTDYKEKKQDTDFFIEFEDIYFNKIYV